MASLEKISKQCLAVCEVPIAAPHEAVTNHVERHLLHGRILDTDKVDGIESDKTLTRLILLLSSEEDVRRFSEEIKQDEIQSEGEVSFTVKYQKAIECELPEQWKHVELESSDGAVQPGPAPPPRKPADQKPTGRDQYQMPNTAWPHGPYGAMSGFYQNISQQAPGGAGPMSEDGDLHENQGQMPHGASIPQHGQMPGQPYSHSDAPGQGQENKHFQAPPGFQGQDPRHGHHMPYGPVPPGHFPPGQFPPGQFPMWGMPPYFQSDKQNLPGGKKMPGHPGMMPFPFFMDPRTGQFIDTRTGQFIPPPGFSNMQHQPAEGGRRSGGIPQPQQPSGPPPPYNSGEFPGQGQCTEVKSPHDIPESDEPGSMDKEFIERTGASNWSNETSFKDGVEKSAEANKMFCQPCNSEGDLVVAIGYCQNCNEYLCAQCLRPHRKQSLTKHHVIHKGKDMPRPQMPHTLLDPCSDPCSQHMNEIVKFFCSSHDAVGCIDCMVLNHRSCKIDQIQDISDSFFTSEEHTDFCGKIDKTVFFSEMLTNQLQKEEGYIDETYKTVLNCIKAFRKEVNDNLDKAEAEILREVNMRKQADETMLFKLKEDKHLFQKEMIELKKKLNQQSDKANDIFVAAKEMKKRTKSIISSLKHIFQNCQVKQYKFEQSPALRQIINCKNPIGQLTEDTTHSREMADGSRHTTVLSARERIERSAIYKELFTEFERNCTRGEYAENVSKRSHKCEGKKLNVVLHVPPKPPRSYGNKILLKGLKASTTQDGLFNFIEAKSRFIPESMDYHADQEDVVMVTFETDIEFEVLKKQFEKFKVEGVTLKASPVSISNCIIVANVATDVTRDTVTYYFEKERKSGGGSVDKVTMNEDNTCFVYFVDYTVIERVLGRKHTLGGQELDVKLYQDCLGRPEGEPGEGKLRIP